MFTERDFLNYKIGIETMNMIIVLSYKPHKINCFSFERIRMKIPRVVLGVLIFSYCIPVADKEDGNIKDFFSIVRDNKCLSEILSEVITRLDLCCSCFFFKASLSSLIIIFNSLKIQPWASVPIATQGELRIVPIEKLS